MKELILPGQDLRLYDKLQEDAHEHDQRMQQFDSKFTMGAPELPEAQIVTNLAKGTFGVAVKGSAFVCELPKGYAGPALELALIDDGRLICTHPNHPPLVINPQNGTTHQL